MIVTANLKRKLKKAQKDGATHVSSICSNHMTTDYFHFVGITNILSSKERDSLSYGRYNGVTQTAFYNENPKADAIRYMDIFKRY